ncbi:hypothetical protein MHO82_14315 [Vibrio sp. Of7-15]|uniref:hypothetical protein n=1 Tax=Vibrio sp. Of7-15 TaxID=2724879 RepID=UPI001EF24C87|nr:hypothetical protein [Vibrio sp. Of7-15]MCG7498041.1 hypothetical protein [Vibrio sp. Of7-15]
MLRNLGFHTLWFVGKPVNCEESTTLRQEYKLEMMTLIAIRLVKLAVICAVFFTIYDLVAFGELIWINRFFGL